MLKKNLKKKKKKKKKKNKISIYNMLLSLLNRNYNIFLKFVVLTFFFFNK